MSFRKKRTNVHEAWLNYIANSSEKLAELEFPSELFESEASFAEFLTSGQRWDLALDLNKIPSAQFWELFRFATSWFDYDTSTFTALEQRRLRGK